MEAGGGERRRYIPGASRRRAGQVSGPHLAAGGAGREAFPRRRGGRGPPRERRPRVERPPVWGAAGRRRPVVGDVGRWDPRSARPLGEWLWSATATATDWIRLGRAGGATGSLSGAACQWGGEGKWGPTRHMRGRLGAGRRRRVDGGQWTGGMMIHLLPLPCIASTLPLIFFSFQFDELQGISHFT